MKQMANGLPTVAINPATDLPFDATAAGARPTAPTVGTDTPVLTISIPSGGTVNLAEVLGIYGMQCALGLGLGITGAFPDTDTTATAAGDVVVSLLYV